MLCNYHRGKKRPSINYEWLLTSYLGVSVQESNWKENDRPLKLRWNSCSAELYTEREKKGQTVTKMNWEISSSSLHHLSDLSTSREAGGTQLHRTIVVLLLTRCSRNTAVRETLAACARLPALPSPRRYEYTAGHRQWHPNSPRVV